MIRSQCPHPIGPHAVGTVGVVGNALALVVLRRDKKSTFNRLLLALSIVDLTVILANSVISVEVMAKVFYGHAGQRAWAQALNVYLIRPIFYLAITLSNLMVVAISAERQASLLSKGNHNHLWLLLKGYICMKVYLFGTFGR